MSWLFRLVVSLRAFATGRGACAYTPVVRFVLALAFVTAAAQAAEPRTAPSDYPAHIDSANAAIGAEYLVHSIPSEEGMLFAPAYLVVEVGFFPNRGDD